MKRQGNLYEQIISRDNLVLADKIARRGKQYQKSIIKHDKKRDENIDSLHFALSTCTYKTSSYKTFIIKEPKERLIYRLPYIDRIVQHAVMNVARPTFISTFTSDTYSCIKGRGIHKAVYAVKEALKDKPNTTYYLKIDIKKFYQSVNNFILKLMLRKKFKDTKFLDLLDGIIDTSQGLPIGNYMSQYLANFYLAYFDHWVKEKMGVRYYFRYADDMVFFSGCKNFLHKLLVDIKEYLNINLDLQVKENHRVAPIWTGLDFLGYVFFENYTRIRKGIKQACARMLISRPCMNSIYSYMGWFGHADTINLQNKLIYGRT
ncbi:MAG: reverse transcriptase domain-containing protein [Bacteroidota bacterium]